MGGTPPGTGAAPSPLLPFCQFLLHRVKTDNLELLKRIVSEYLNEPSSFATIDSMVRFAFPVITVLPADNDSADDRDRADAILVRMKRRSQTIGPRAKNDMKLLSAALGPRVELKNWDWLQQIYDEFCFGDDRALGDFIQLQQQAISIIPARPIESTDAPEDATEMPIVVVDAAVATPDARRSRKSRSDDDAVGEDRVLSALKDMVKKRPWEKIYDVSKIEYPFDHVAHPMIAESLKHFWRKHARAAWERQFWYFYNPPTDHLAEQDERKNRQDSATRFFENNVIAPLYQAVGPQFFVDLDARPEQAYWWWYRTPVVNMQKLGDDECLKYLEANAFERFPATPSGLEYRPFKYSAGHSAMWAALAKYQPYRDEIDRIKRALRVKKAAARKA